MNKDVCEDCEKEKGIWMIYIRKKFKKIHGKKSGLVCDNCLIDSITGYHTGGGLTSESIKKIVRKRN